MKDLDKMIEQVSDIITERDNDLTFFPGSSIPLVWAQQSMPSPDVILDVLRVTAQEVFELENKLSGMYRTPETES